MARLFFFHRWKITLKMLYWTAAPVVGIFAIVGIILGVSLSSGPVSFDFAIPYIEGYLAPKDAPFSMHMEHADLAWDKENTCLVIKANGMHIKNHGIEHNSLHLPDFEFRYHLTSLLKLKVIPSEIAIIKPHIHLYQDENGGLSLNKDPNPQGSGEWSSVLEDPAFKSLKEIHINDLSLDIEILKTSETVSLPKSNLHVTRNGAQIICEIASNVYGGTAQAKAVIDQSNVHISGQLLDFEFDHLYKFWHEKFAPHPRKWVIENLSKGRVPKATIEAHWQLDLSTPTPLINLKTMDGHIHFKDMNVHYFGEMPPVTGVEGLAHYSHEMFDIDIFKGQLKDVFVESGKVYINGLNEFDQDIKIDVDIKGPINTAIDVLDCKPLIITKKLGLKPQKFVGIAKGRVHFDFPLSADLNESQINFGAKAALNNVCIHGLDQGILELNLNRSLLSVAGSAQYQGIPAKVSWEQKLDDNPKDWKAKYTLNADLSIDHMAQLGYGGYTEKPIAIKAQYLEHETALSQLFAEINFGSFMFIKTPGKATIEACLKNGKIESVQKLNVAGQDIRFNPKLTMTPQTNRIKSLDCPDLKLGKTEVALKILEDNKHVYHIDIKGKSLDLDVLIDQLKKAKSGQKSTPYYFKCSVQNAWFHQASKSIQQMQASGFHNTDSLQTLLASGQIMDKAGNNIGDIHINQKMHGSQKELHLTSSNAGEALDVLGITPSLRQGSLSLLMTKTPTSDWFGKLKIKDFHVKNAPIFTRMLSMVSPFGIIDAVSGTPMAFSKFSTHIIFSGDTITLKDGRGVGSSIGFTVVGKIDQKLNTIDIHGTILPYNAVNVFLAKIPVINTLLGGKGGGIFGLNYGLSGPMDEPYSYVNPLSVLTPGILRSVFSHSSGD